METLTIDQALAVSQTEHEWIEAQVGADKDGYAARLAQNLAQTGTAPERIWVAVRSHSAARDMAERLGELDRNLVNVRVATAEDEALRVLSEEHARASTGRAPMVATRAELSVVAADFVAGGCDARAVRRVIAHPLAEVRNDEERVAQERLASCLRAYKRIHADEVVPLALSVLDSERDGASAGEGAFRYDAIVACDFAEESEIAQHLIEKLAPLVAAVSWACVPGVQRERERFCTACPDATPFTLAAREEGNLRVTAFAQAMLERDSAAYDAAVEEGRLAPDDNRVALLKWRTPELEASNVSRLVKRALTADEGAEPRDVYVAVPNRVWANAACASLERGGFESTVALDNDPFALAAHSKANQQAMLAFARLGLLADADDPMAWRLWCAVNMHDHAVVPWAAFAEWGRGNGWNVRQAAERLNAVGDDAFEGAGSLKPVIQRGISLLKKAGLRGYSLVRACTPEGSTVFSQVTGAVTDAVDAPALAAEVRAQCRSQAFELDNDMVRVGSFDCLRGVRERTVIVLGAMQGFLPSAASLDARVSETARANRLARERLTFGLAVSQTSEQLVLSTFQKAQERTASALKLQVKRYKMERGQKLAMLARSQFIDDAMNAAPGAVSGEQFLAQAERERVQHGC